MDIDDDVDVDVTSSVDVGCDHVQVNVVVGADFVIDVYILRYVLGLCSAFPL